MKKQLGIELKELAISVLKNNSETSVTSLKEQTAAIYERLCILDYINNNSKTTEESESTVIPEKTKAPIQINHEITLAEPELIEIKKESLIKTSVKLEVTPEKKPIETNVSDQSSPDLLFELEELTAGFENMPEFERAVPTNSEKQTTNVNETTINPNTSLNESLKKGINIGLNDRLAFVKHLFNNNQQDYTRVISQLNTLESSSGAANFIQQMVKPEYNNWEGKEAFEERFINAVFSKFDH